MKLLICLLLAILPFSLAHAKKTHKVDRNPANYTSDTKKSSSQWKLPHGSSRDTIFSEAGINKDINEWDELDKDMLYLRARQLSLEDLEQKYPALNKGKLERLKDFIPAAGGGQLE